MRVSRVMGFDGVSRATDRSITPSSFRCKSLCSSVPRLRPIRAWLRRGEPRSRLAAGHRHRRREAALTAVRPARCCPRGRHDTARPSPSSSRRCAPSCWPVPPPPASAACAQSPGQPRRGFRSAAAYLLDVSCRTHHQHLPQCLVAGLRDDAQAGLAGRRMVFWRQPQPRSEVAPRFECNEGEPKRACDTIRFNALSSNSLIPSNSLKSEKTLMKSHAQVVVIGGGVVGCSVLFHLARHGWTDIVLLERDELTSGSTWHAAGGMHTINGDPNVAKLQKYTIDLYKEIEELSGQATGVHLTGGVLLAATEARMDWLRGVVAKGRYLGIDLEEISAKRSRRADAAARPEAVRRRGAQHRGRPSRSVRRHPRLCQGGAEAGRCRRALHQGRGHRAPRRRDVARHHQQGRDRRRACRQCRRPVGARGRPHGRAGTAGAGHGAHVPDHRGHAGGRRLERRRPAPRSSMRSISTASCTCARSAAAC